MFVNLATFLPTGVTVINRIAANDRSDGIKQDAFRATYIPDAIWGEKSDAASGDNTLVISRVVKVHLPVTSDGKEYLPYADFVANGGYTASAGDWIIKAEVTEPITADNYRTIIKEYGALAMTIGSVSDLRRDGISDVGGIIGRYINTIYCEGM